MGSHPVEGDYLRQPVWINIRTVLMEHWDPIGVSEMPEAADEYDSYIPNIKALLRAGACEAPGVHLSLIARQGSVRAGVPLLRG